MFFKFLVLFWLLLLAIRPAFSQFLSPPTDLTSKLFGPSTNQVRYKEVPPGICEQRDDIKSFSGYVDVSSDEHIFFWFFEARNTDPTTAPLTTWINGGPGASSMIGLFQEIGPCTIDTDGNVVNNVYSWTNSSNLLFIDQPVQTGFSYSTTTPGYINQENGLVVALPDGVCPSDEVTNGTCGTYSNPDGLRGIPVSTYTAAASFYATLQGFMAEFPQYARQGIHLATESYGGHYGPVFAEYIEAQNARAVKQTMRVSLETLTIINGWMNPIIQYAAYYNFTVSPGNTYDYMPYSSTNADRLYANLYDDDGCVDRLNNCATSGIDSICAAADHFCLQYIENFFDAATSRDEYDIRQLAPDPYPPETYVSYLNSATVQAAIGAYVNYTEDSTAVALAFNTTGDDGRLVGITTDVRGLLRQGVAVTMIYGDADYNSNWLGGEAVYESLHTGNPGYVNISTPDSVVHGQAKQIGSFAFARVYDSGHEVPYYQPLTALTLFDRAIKGHDIATGQTKVTEGYRTEGEAQSTYREGNSSIKFNNNGGVAGQATTYAAPSPGDEGLGGSGSAGGRMLGEVDGDTVGLVPLNGTSIPKLALAPHGGVGGRVVGLVNPGLKHKVEQMVHISQRKRRRRGVRGGHLK